MSLLALSLLTPSFACPTIATGTPSELSFDTAQVAIVRQDNQTTFSVSINPEGDPQEFALVMPVPVILAEEDIKTLDPEIFGRLDGYTGPRNVYDAGCPYSYGGYGGGCDTGGYYDYSASSSSSDSGGDDPYGSVDVEAEYLVGSYEITILSAEDSGDLFGWLNANGYYLAKGADARLQEYIDAGSYFLAARVSGDAAGASGDSLSPLQVSYESEIFSIPIRLAAMNSPGEQDMVIYAVTDLNGTKDGGLVGIANYEEFEVPDKCIWGNGTENFNEYYKERFSESWEAVGEGAWTVEYAGTWNDCSPCSNIAITPKDLRQLGYSKSSFSGSDHHLTRIRMRYTPEQAVEDLVLYGSGIYEPLVTSFADMDNAHNGTCIEYCNPEDAPPEPETTEEEPDEVECDTGEVGATPSDGGGDDEKGGCSTGGAVPGASFALLGLVSLLIRRRKSAQV